MAPDEAGQMNVAENERAREAIAQARAKLAGNDPQGGLALLKDVKSIACAPALKSEAAKLLAAAGANADAIACYMQAGKSFLFEQTDVLRARQALAAAHALDPNDLEVIFEMGMADVAEGHTQDGLAKFIDILRRSNLKHVPALFQAGCIYQKNSQFDQAILAFKKVLDRDKRHIQAMVHMGQLHQAKGMKPEAIGYFLSAANASREEKQLGAARQMASMALTVDPKNAKARLVIDELDEQEETAPAADTEKAAPPEAAQAAQAPPAAVAEPVPPAPAKPVIEQVSSAPSQAAVPPAPATAPETPQAAAAPKVVLPDPEHEAAFLSLKQIEARRKQAQENLQALLQSSDELERVLGEQRGLLENAMSRKSELDREIAQRAAALESARTGSAQSDEASPASQKRAADRAKAERALVDLRAEHDALVEEHRSERAALEEVRSDLRAARAHMQETAASHADLARQVADLEAMLQAAREARVEADTAAQTALAQQREAEGEAAAARAAVSRAEADHANVSARRSASEQQIAEFNAARKEAEERAAQAQADLSELEGRIETAQVDVERRQQQLRALTSQIELAQATAKEEAAKVNEALSAAERAESLRIKREAEAEALAQRAAVLEASIQDALSRHEPPVRRSAKPTPLPPLPREEPEGFQPLARADAWAAAGDFGRAAEAYRQVLDENPDDAGASYHLACILADHFEDYESAETLLARAAKLRRDHVATQYRQAVVMTQTGRVAQGVAKLLELVRRDESNAEFMDQFVERMEHDASHGDAEAKYRLGMAYRELGRVEEALVAFQGIQREPEYVVKCLIGIGLCLRRQGLDGAAAKRFSKALETPGYPESQYHEALYQLADLYEAKGTEESLRLALSSLEELYASDISYLDVADRIRVVKAKLQSPESPKVTRLPTRTAEPPG